ncbi:hypothetical protein MLD52_04310 [Puniceicoccaceae bacterium K14]|nr:hypothetical protein [Puniceicoccaceae bacterium K14]
MSFLTKKGSSASRTERNHIRALLKKSGQGNSIAFTQVFTCYANFLSCYFYTLGYTDADARNREIEKTLVKIWKYLPYTKRVSDLERFLFIQLGDEQPLEGREFPELHAYLANLRHEHRFLLVARIFERWNYKELKLALRANEKEIAFELMTVKSKLIGFQSHLLKLQEKARIVQISELLEGNISEKNSRKIETQIATEYSSLQFKADWLAYRCELAELLESIRMAPEEQEELKERIPELIKSESMARPKLTDNLSNLVSFDVLPSR